MLSIITPVLNGEKFIIENLRSVSKLSVPYEHIIVDGNSTDSTADIIESFNNPKIKIVTQSNENKGMYGAINQGIGFTRGNYLCYLNCDDKFIPANFDKLYKKIESEKLDCVYSDAMIVYLNDEDQTYHPGIRNAHFFLSKGIMPFVQPTTIFSKSIYTSIGGFDDRYRLIGDLDFFSRLFKKTKNVGYYNIPTVKFLRHEESLLGQNEALHIIERKENGYNINFLYKVLYSALLKLEKKRRKY